MLIICCQSRKKQKKIFCKNEKLSELMNMNTFIVLIYFNFKYRVIYFLIFISFSTHIHSLINKQNIYRKKLFLNSKLLPYCANNYNRQKTVIFIVSVFFIGQETKTETETLIRYFINQVQLIFIYRRINTRSVIFQHKRYKY